MAAVLDHRLMEPFGAEVDLDLSQPLSDEQARALRDLFYDRFLLLFRGQRLSMADQTRAVAYVAQVLPPSSGYLTPEDGILNTVALDFHADLSATPLPFDAISLHALEVDDGATSTKFASGMRAYRRLPAELKARVADLQVNMVQTLADKSKLSYDVGPDDFSYVRPLVHRHRTTGEPLLICSESSSARIEGWAKPQSDALLAELFGYIYAPDNQLEHVWRTGDFILWDNLSLQHGRPAVTPGRPRRLQRVVAGLKTLREQVPGYSLSPVITEVMGGA